MAVADQQLLRGVAANLRAEILDSDGDPATGLTVTVGVAKADGTEVIAPGAATTENPAASGIYTVAATAAQLGALELLVATWNVSTDTRAITTHEVVGGYYCTTAEIKAGEPSLAAADPDDLKARRRDVEDEFEAICRVAFVPRYARFRLDGSGCSELLLPTPLVRTVRSVRSYSGVSFSALDAPALASIVPAGAAKIEIVRTDRGTFPAGRQNIVIEYEHGYDRPPGDVKREAIARIRSRQNKAVAGVPANATSWTAENGATYRLPTPSATTTGNVDVDGVLERYSLRAGIA